MDQKTNSALANCYSEISDIWLSTAEIARLNLGKFAFSLRDAEWWEKFQRRCCIRAGYYARLAEQHRAQSPAASVVYTGPRLRSADEIDELFRQTSVEPKGRAGGLARAKKLSPKRRSEIARKAAKTRWVKEHPAQLEMRKRPNAS